MRAATRLRARPSIRATRQARIATPPQTTVAAIR